MRIFDNILLLGRPAAGKSELTDCLKSKSDSERAELFHIGRFEELDDFPWLWEKFIEDNMWEESGYERLYSHREENNCGLNEGSKKLFDLMLARLNKVVGEKYKSSDEFYDDGTLFIEFSRGAHGGYSHALPRLSEEILKRAAILYIRVSFEESWRRNLARYEEKKKHSVLAHMATRRVMEAFYRDDDWDLLTGGRDCGYIDVKGIEIPFVTVLNEPEIKDPGRLAERYGPAFDHLMNLYAK